MTQQKSDDRIVPKGGRKLVPTGATRGGKAVTVKVEAARQVDLPFATAVGPQQRVDTQNAEKPSVDRVSRPKATSKGYPDVPATMERVVERLERAFDKVAANQGAPGPDRKTIEQVRQHLTILLPVLGASLLDGSYRVGDIRRVYIPKSGGGERGLGIPNVVDRTVQEAVRSVLEPIYEPMFHPSSHGFRPNRGCQTAIAPAREHLASGDAWVVDLDLEKFFDRVSHQRLMSRLAQRVGDRRLLALIGQMLKASVVMPDGVKVATEEGVPQGGPLSPLLSNVVLDELDHELSRRGHRFVRYADDCNIYVRSEQAGKRVMASVTRFIERRLRLKVNAAKSAVARPEMRHFLGYRLRKSADGVEVLLSERSEKRLRERIRELTPRNWGQSVEDCIRKINAYTRGWFGHFGICTSGVERPVTTADAHIRRRLRAITLRHWKTKRTMAIRLIKLGVKRKTAWRNVYEGRKSIWALSHNPAVDRAMPKSYFSKLGFEPIGDRFRETWAAIAAPAQLALPWVSTCGPSSLSRRARGQGLPGRPRRPHRAQRSGARRDRRSPRGPYAVMRASWDARSACPSWRRSRCPDLDNSISLVSERPGSIAR
jgi:group II intron reverse transcriptase/maturase